MQGECRHLGVLVQSFIAGDQHGSAEGAVALHDGVADLLAGAVRRFGIAVQGVHRHGGAVVQHGGLEALDGAVGAVVEHLGIAPFGAVIIAVHDLVLGGEVHQAALRGGAVHAAPEHDGLACAVDRYRGGQIGGGVLRQAGCGPTAGVAAVLL